MSRRILRDYQVEWHRAVEAHDMVAILGARQIGKDFTAAFIAVLLAVRTSTDVLCANKDQRQSTKFLRVVADLVQAMGRAGVEIMEPDSGKMTAIRLRSDNGRSVVIQSRPGNPNAIQGFVGHVICNELGASRHDPEEVLGQVLSATSSRRGLKSILITNATRRGSFLDRWWNDPAEKWERLRRPWHQTKTTIHDVYPDGLPEHIRARKEGYTRSAWARWMLCEFTSHGDGTFERWLEDYETPSWAEGGGIGRRIMMIDVGATRHPTAILCMESTAKGWRDCWAELLRGLPLTDLPDVAVERMKALGASKIVIDRGGIGAAPHQELERRLTKQVVIGASVNRQMLSAGSQKLVDMFAHGQIAIRSPELLEHLREVTGDADADDIVLPEMQEHNGEVHHCDLAAALLSGASLLGSAGERQLVMPPRRPRGKRGMRKGFSR